MAAQEQKIEFLFAAQVSGQAQLFKLTESVDSLRKEMEALKAANGGVGASMAGFSKSVGNASSHVQAYQKHLDAQAKAMRNHRQGTQQLGMQFNDLGTSISTGASPLQAFNQQIGQIGFAMSMMGGTAGKVGGFLAGPWGAAITIATAVLVPLIMNLFGASDAAKELKESEDKVRDSSIGVMFAKAELDKALGKNIDSYILASNTAIQAGLDDLESAKDTVAAARLRMLAAKQESKALAMLGQIGGPVGQATAFVAGLFGVGDRTKAVKEANAASEALDKETESLTRLLTARQNVLNPRSRPSPRVSTGRSGAGQTGKSDFEKQQDKDAKSLEDFFNLIERGNTKELPEYARQIMAIEEAFLKLNATQQESDKNKFTKIFAQDKIFLKEGQDQISDYLKTPIEAPQMSVEMEDIISKADEMNKSFEEIGNSVSEAFKGMLTGAMSWKDGMRSLISSVIDQLWKLFVVQKIVGIVSSALGGASGMPGNMGSAGDALKLLPAIPANAYGGSVMGNRPTLVGERGPELFVPGGNGTIIPNGNMRGGNGGGSSFNISVDARGSNDPAAVRAQVQQGILEAAPAIIAAAESRTISSLRRPRLGGAMQ